MYIIIFSLFCLFTFTYQRFLKRKKLPKQYSNSKFVNYENKDDSMIHRNGFSKKKIPKDIDVIVIGSGIGGLSCAAFLSKVGKRVLVLEQHYIAGGSTHSFEDKGYEFDTGIHYIGNIEKRAKILDLITDSKIEWDQMGNKENGFLYDEIAIEDKMYHLRAGKEEFLKEVKKNFPEELDNVKRYLDYVKEVSEKDDFFNMKIIRPKFLLKCFSNKKFFNSVNETALEVVKRFTKNEDLQAFLCGQFGDYGRVPSEESFFLHASVVNHYMNGGWFPHGGSSVIAKKIIPTIKKTGGEVLVRKGVKQILFENKKAVGVEMVNGDKIYSKKVVSACGVYNTFNKLIPQDITNKNIIQKIKDIGMSCSFTYVFIGMNKDHQDLDLRSSNIWHWPNKDYDKMMDDFYKDPAKAPIPMFIGFPCAKDKTWKTRYPGKSNAVILTISRYQDFEKWNEKKQGKRGEEYNKIKDMYANRILEEGLYHYYPKTRGTVDYVQVGTPVTFNHYIGSTKGEVYGLKSSPIRFSKNDWLRPDTEYKNLYLTGQDITTLGVTGALMSGVLTAHSILGYGSILDVVEGRNLISDLINLNNVRNKKKID